MVEATARPPLRERRPHREREPPATPGGAVLLPGDIERRTRAERLANGIPLDPNALAQLRDAARAVGLSDPEIDRGIAPTETSPQS